MHCHKISFILSLFKFFLIVDDSFSRLTTRMIVHDSISVSCFPQTSAGSCKMAARSSSRGSTAASEIPVYIQDDHDKENIKDEDNVEKMSSEESVNSQELGETPQKKEAYH